MSKAKKKKRKHKGVVEEFNYFFPLKMTRNHILRLFILSLDKTEWETKKKTLRKKSGKRYYQLNNVEKNKHKWKIS